MSQVTARQQPIGTRLSPPAASRRGRTTTVGRVVQVLVVAFLLVDGVLRIAGFAPYVEGTTRYGFAESAAPWIGGALLLFTLLYAIPRTTVLGAILVSAYLGAAAASHLRVGEPPWFPIVIAVLTWGALYLLDARVRALLPMR